MTEDQLYPKNIDPRRKPINFDISSSSGHLRVLNVTIEDISNGTILSIDNGDKIYISNHEVDIDDFLIKLKDLIFNNRSSETEPQLLTER